MRYPLVSFSFLLFIAAPASAEDLFATKVRPILARYCFKCHGPDDAARKAKLRLHDRDAAIKQGAIAPGKPDQSEMIARIFSDDDTTLMPPPSTKLEMTKSEKDTLKKWITDGAGYTPHWAFVAPKRPALPAIKDITWTRTPIDRFVLARLERVSMKPSPEADRYTLVRRVYLDLVGLPPTPEEADAFVNDTAVDAYERLVDRLLASPRYGERWARRWLDLARYSDTNGYEKDRPRSIWPYRDWVIGAINDDLPFDQFSVEQLAGDMLPNATQSQKIATGFHRNTMLNEEGGIDPLEFRFHAMTDRVATTGTVWLGLTLGCAQCHTHKYDPVTQKEYYQFFAFLNNANEPDLDVIDPTVTKRRNSLLQQIAKLESELPKHLPIDPKKKETFADRFNQWLKSESSKAVHWSIVKPTSARGSLPLLTIQKDNSIFVTGDQSKSDTYEVNFPSTLDKVTALRLEVLPDDRLPKHGPGRIYYEGPIGDFFLSEISLFADGKKIALKEATQSFASGNNTAAQALDGDQQSGWSINGGQGRAHSAVFRLAEPLTAAKKLSVKMLFERYYAAGVGRFRLSLTGDDKPAVARDMADDVERLLLLPSDKLKKEQRAILEHQFVKTTPDLAKERKAIDTLRSQLPAYSTTLVMDERPRENPRRTFIHHRGEFLQTRDEVSPDVPAILHSFPKDAPRNRLAFARWLVSPDNALVGRVTVNRHWAVFFGRGIVPTVGDFGLQGELPSHPELLDWLALEFINEGWSVKRLHRLIVMSSTYRQSSRSSIERNQLDPSNRLLGRGPRVRLDAEQVRDFVLRASGLLAEKSGGPSVFPPQPASVTTEGTYGQLRWQVSPGLDRYRRGLYTYSKRTAPFALFGTFDGPSGEVCVARRDTSNTPLQALTLLNDQAIHEAAQHLGNTMANEKGTFTERAKRLYRRILTRPPTDRESKMILTFLETQMRRFFNKELDASAVAGPGTGDVNERAAWTTLTRALFNLDESIVKG